MNSFGRDISIVNRAAYGWFARTLAPYGVGPGQQAYLLALQPDECIRQEDLAARLQVDKASVTRAVAALEKLGMLTRSASGRDGRERLLQLTTAGLELRSVIENSARQWLSRLQAGFSPEEWRQLETLVGRLAIVAALAADTADASAAGTTDPSSVTAAAAAPIDSAAR